MVTLLDRPVLGEMVQSVRPSLWPSAQLSAQTQR